MSSSTLIIFGGAFEPTEVSQHLGLVPWHSWRKGEKQSHLCKDDSIIDLGTAKWSGWKHKLPDELTTQPLETQLEAWCKYLRPREHGLQIIQNLAENIHLDCSIASSSSTASLVVSPAVQKTLSQLGVSLVVTFYTCLEPDHAT